jgi:hypothetical protein
MPRSVSDDPGQKDIFGSPVVSDCEHGSPIVWRGEYVGKTYEDRGEILDIEPEGRLKVTHFSPVSGREAGPTSTPSLRRSARFDFHVWTGYPSHGVHDSESRRASSGSVGFH